MISIRIPHLSRLISLIKIIQFKIMMKDLICYKVRILYIRMKKEVYLNMILPKKTVAGF